MFKGTTDSIALLTASLLGITLSGCGGGGGGGGGVASSLSGSSASGTITGFGSVYVNGVRWETDSAEIWIDEELSEESQLRLGQRVRVEGSSPPGQVNGVATRVVYDDDLEGPIESLATNLDGDVTELTILGWTVEVVDGFTTFEDTSFSSLSVGDVVEVSGIPDGDSRLLATRIEFEGTFTGAPVPVEFTGTTSNLDRVAGTVTVGSVSVLFDDETEIEDDLANGQRVEVEGLYDGGSVQAEEIDDADEEDRSERAYASFEGFIENFDPMTRTFDLRGLSVDASSATFYPSDLSGFPSGILVRVEGSVSGGVLTATVVEARSADVEISAAIAATSDIDLVDGSISLLGVRVRVDATTRLEDDDEDLLLSDIAAGDFLEVRGTYDPDSGEVLATRVEREDEDSEVELKGPLEAFTSSSVTILGVEIPFNDETEFEDENDDDISRESILVFENIGRIFEATDDDDGDPTTIDVAEEIELEDLAEFGLESAADDDDDDEDDDDDDDESVADNDGE